MQILIAAQGVTPNSVEINTNCIPPARLPAGCHFRRVASIDEILAKDLRRFLQRDHPIG